MLEILEFIFQDFAHFLGTLALLIVVSFWRFAEVSIDRSTTINGANVDAEVVDGKEEG